MNGASQSKGINPSACRSVDRSTRAGTRLRRGNRQSPPFPEDSRGYRDSNIRGGLGRFPQSHPSGDLLIHHTLSRTLKPKEPTMTIEIRDASLEARIRKQLQATGSSSVEEVLLRLLARRRNRTGGSWKFSLQESKNRARVVGIRALCAARS